MIRGWERKEKEKKKMIAGKTGGALGACTTSLCRGCKDLSNIAIKDDIW
jgi:hypothetical protein